MQALKNPVEHSVKMHNPNLHLGAKTLALPYIPWWWQPTRVFSTQDVTHAPPSLYECDCPQQSGSEKQIGCMFLAEASPTRVALNKTCMSLTCGVMKM
jgi:hypothetical protein